MRIAVIGTGYVGLTTGTCLASVGHNVICVDNNKDKIKNLEKGIIPIYEPKLDDLVVDNIKACRLAFTDNLEFAVKNSDIIFISVGTPQDSSGFADLSYVESAAEMIAKSMNGYKLIVQKSTVPVGTSDRVSEIIRKNTKYDFDIVSNPEFLKQGHAVDDFLLPDRIIIGSDSEKATEWMKVVYSYCMNKDKIIFMDVKSAEMTKYAANAFLATKISFINEMANLCEKLHADIEQVRIGICSDQRIGKSFLYPGVGYGGSCFPKDVNSIIKTAEQVQCPMRIMNAVCEVNKCQRELFVQKITKRFGDDLKGLIFGVWGLSFKPETDDLREAPSVSIINSLLDRGAEVKVFDPKAMDNFKKLFGDKVTYAENSYDAADNADALLLITEWREFRTLDFSKLNSVMRQKNIFDGRNLYSSEKLEENGFKYYCVGRDCK